MIRRLTAVALVCASLGMGVSACSIAGHKIPTGVTQAAWCGFHVWRLERDIRHHHLGWGAFQAVLAAHHCSRVARSVVGL